jgi:hypothetical protein
MRVGTTLADRLTEVWIVDMEVSCNPTQSI